MWQQSFNFQDFHFTFHFANTKASKSHKIPQFEPKQRKKEQAEARSLSGLIIRFLNPFVLTLPRRRPYRGRRRGRRSLREHPTGQFRGRCRYRDHRGRGRIHIHRGKLFILCLCEHLKQNAIKLYYQHAGGIIMRSILDELFYGNICGTEDSWSCTEEVKELSGYIADYHDNIRKSLRTSSERFLTS